MNQIGSAPVLQTGVIFVRKYSHQKTRRAGLPN